MVGRRRGIRRGQGASPWEEPKVGVADALLAYLDAAKTALDAGTKHEVRHVREIPLTSNSRHNDLVERLNGTVRGRHESVRGLKAPEGPMTAGQSAYYNLMRPRQGLEGKTPAEAAALKAGSVDGNGWPGLIGEAAHQNETGVKANGHQPST